MAFHDNLWMVYTSPRSTAYVDLKGKARTFFLASKVFEKHARADEVEGVSPAAGGACAFLYDGDPITSDAIYLGRIQYGARGNLHRAE